VVGKEQLSEASLIMLFAAIQPFGALTELDLIESRLAGNGSFPISSYLGRLQLTTTAQLSVKKTAILI